MRAYLVTIRQRDEETREGVRWRVTHLRAIARSSADALLGVMDRLPVNSRVAVFALPR